MLNWRGCDGDDLTLIDLRPKTAFSEGHVKTSQSLPLSETIDDFFGDSYAVKKRWLELTDLLAREPWLLEKASGTILIVCTEGDTGRMAASMLRARGREAFSLEGGFEAITAYERGERRVYFR
jgi:rhodanese-related sulfurtransferase